MSLDTGFEIGDVLLRGAPLRYARDIIRHRELMLDDSYATWLQSTGDTATVIKAFEPFRSEANKVFGSPELADDLVRRMNTGAFISAVISGDTEIAYMNLINGWGLRNTARNEKLADSSRRYNRQAARVGRIIAALIELDKNTDIDEAMSNEPEMMPTIGEWDSDSASEGIHFAGHMRTLAILGSLLDYRTGPPQRGIKNVNEHITELATGVNRQLNVQSDSKEVVMRRDGAILEAEVLMTLWRACQLGLLKKSWPIMASQRLDLGFFRYSADRGINTDIVCLEPADHTAIPIQVKSSSDFVTGEGSLLTVIRRRDLYPRRYGADVGAFTRTALGEEGGVSQDFMDSRAGVVADRIVAFREKVAA
jgi:hypothetical protein